MCGAGGEYVGRFLSFVITAAPPGDDAAKSLFFQQLGQGAAAGTLPVGDVAHVVQRPAGAFAHHQHFILPADAFLALTRQADAQGILRASVLGIVDASATPLCGSLRRWRRDRPDAIPPVDRFSRWRAAGSGKVFRSGRAVARQQLAVRQTLRRLRDAQIVKFCATVSGPPSTQGAARVPISL